MNVSQNAKFALVIAAKPDAYNPQLISPEPERRWREFSGDARLREMLQKGFYKIHENVWQIDLNNTMPLLADLLALARQYEIRLHILFSDAEPDWIKYPPDAKTADESKPS